MRKGPAWLLGGVLVIGAALAARFGASVFHPRADRPTQSRPVATTCAKARPAGKPGATANSTCKQDADCTAGHNGRCLATHHGDPRQLAVDECSYDRCFVDADCGLGVCLCGHDAATADGEHRCVLGDCRVDADCGSGGFCSPSYGLCSHDPHPTGFFCHSDRDECFTNSDCPKTKSDVARSTHVQCGYSRATRRWVCMSEQCPVG